MHLEDFDPQAHPDAEPADLADRWIESRLNRTVHTVNEALKAYKVNEASLAIYRFVWHEFCDWYVEIVKPRLATNGASRRAAQALLVQVLETSVRLLHPFMPFLTEEVWQHLPGTEGSVMVAPFPVADEKAIDEDAEANMGRVIEAVNAIRNVRGEMNIKPRQTVDVTIRSADESLATLYRDHAIYFTDLARVGALRIGTALSKPDGAAVSIVDGAEIFTILPPESLELLVAEEQNRLEKGLQKIRRDLVALETKLANKDFFTKAPEAVIAKDKGRHASLLEKEARLKESIEALRKRS
jgi:valyl-tRNA synthetase